VRSAPGGSEHTTDKGFGERNLDCTRVYASIGCVSDIILAARLYPVDLEFPGGTLGRPREDLVATSFLHVTRAGIGLYPCRRRTLPRLVLVSLSDPRVIDS
jgi:hypothetical protein